MRTYEIKISREITKYVMNENYKWLYRKIDSGEYEFNKGAASLILEIRKSGKITDETYNKFIGMMDNSPSHRLLHKEKEVERACVSTDKLLNYFVVCGGHILPIGFIVEFFEDDYESSSAVETLVKDFVDFDNRNFELQCSEELAIVEDKLDRMNNLYNDRFRVKWQFHFFNLFRFAMVIFLIVMFFSFCSNIHLFEVLKDFVFDAKCDMDVNVTAVKKMTAYYMYDANGLGMNGLPFTYGQYFSKYIYHILFNEALFVFICVYLVKTVKYMIFMIRSGLLYFNLKFKRNALNKLRYKGGISLLKNHVEEVYEIVKELNKERHAFIPSNRITHKFNFDYLNLSFDPKKDLFKKFYFTPIKIKFFNVISFDFDKENTKQLSLVNNKSFRFLCFYYENEKYAQGIWRKGTVILLLLSLFFFVFNHSTLSVSAYTFIREIYHNLSKYF